MEIKKYIGEVWKDIYYYDYRSNEQIDYRGLYQVSNYGRVKSLPRKGTIHAEKILSQGKCGNYLNVRLYKNNESDTYYVHRLVIGSFVPNPNKYKEVNHRDENTFNNNLSNLEFCDRAYNVNYGTGPQRRAETQGKAVLQYDRDGVLIKRFVSIAEAQRETKTWGISAFCRGTRKQTGEYIWKYEKEVDD